MRAWVLKSRPEGVPERSDFELADLPDRPLEDGQIRVRNRWLSVDPYMRGRMNDVKSYVPPFALDEPMQGGAVGEVLESRNPGFAPGDKVLHMAGWRDEAVIGAEAMPQKLPDIGVSDDTWLHNLGLTGGTAYFGLLRVAEAKAGDIVFVSAAAGAVGSAVVQIAKLKGMTVIGSAGGPDKVAFVKQLGADACIDYKAGAVLPQLAQAAPQGIDVYFDNVGGEHLDAAFATARQWARFAICGMIDVYNDGKPQELKYLIRTIPTRLTMRGFLWTDFFGELDTFQREMGAWVASDQIKARTTVKDGIESTLDAFLGLFEGANTSKMLVRL
ncbi:MAG TPA: NADP-dependent oxidoreductase [Sphingomonas sp.]|nr:NADP-dependent oxidoreductase [Sphingomonas sp.]